MTTYLVFDATGADHTTDPQGWCIPMNTYDSELEWAVSAVQRDVEPKLSQLLGTLTGKDAGWYAEPEPDGTVIVERRFTERRGMQYSPRVWAWTVTNALQVQPNNDAATTFAQESLT